MKLFYIVNRLIVTKEKRKSSVYTKQEVERGRRMRSSKEETVAPNYMGAQEFTVAKSVYEHLLR